MPIFSTNISRCFVYRQKSLVKKNQAVIAGVRRGGLGRHFPDVISVVADFRFLAKNQDVRKSLDKKETRSVFSCKKIVTHSLISSQSNYNARKLCRIFLLIKRQTNLSNLICFQLSLTDKEVKCICGRNLTLPWCCHESNVINDC